MLPGDILNAEQNRGIATALVEDLPSVQAHRTMSKAGKLMLDLITLHHALLGNDFFQQHAKLWNVPLFVAQRVKKSAFGVLGTNLECRIEGAACGDHTKVFVEHQNGLTVSVDDALSECPRVYNGGELFSKVGLLHSASGGLIDYGLGNWKNAQPITIRL